MHVQPLRMPVDAVAGDVGPDWSNYDPERARPDRHNAFPKRQRVRPIDDWAGEQPLYKCGMGARVVFSLLCG